MNGKVYVVIYCLKKSLNFPWDQKENRERINCVTLYLRTCCWQSALPSFLLGNRALPFDSPMTVTIAFPNGRTTTEDSEFAVFFTASI